MRAESERLIIRPCLSEDSADIFKITANAPPDSGFAQITDIKKLRRFISQASACGVFCIELKKEHKVIGLISLSKDRKRSYNRVRMLSFIILNDFEKRGYCTEAAEAVLKYGFENLDLSLITAYCYPSNLSSASVLKKLGFEFEGRLSCCEKRFDGKICDHDCYVIKAEKYSNFAKFQALCRENLKYG